MVSRSHGGRVSERAWAGRVVLCHVGGGGVRSTPNCRSRVALAAAAVTSRLFIMNAHQRNRDEVNAATGYKSPDRFTPDSAGQLIYTIQCVLYKNC